MPKRHRARLLHRGNLQEKLKGRTWGSLLQGNGNFAEIDDIIFRIRVGDFVGMPHIAVMAAGQFIVMRRVNLEQITNLGVEFTEQGTVLDPRRAPYGLDTSWYITFGKHDEVAALMNSLIIEEPNETPDDHT